MKSDEYQEYLIPTVILILPGDTIDRSNFPRYPHPPIRNYA